MKDRASNPSYEERLVKVLGVTGVPRDAMSVARQLDLAWKELQATLDREAFRPHGLSHAGWSVLVATRVFGPQEIRVIARLLGTTRASVVSCVDTLERYGLVTRKRSDEDRRMVDVQITEEGKRRCIAAHKDVSRLEVAATGALTNTERRELARLLHKVRDTLRELSGSAALTDDEVPLKAKPAPTRGKRAR